MGTLDWSGDWGQGEGWAAGAWSDDWGWGLVTGVMTQAGDKGGDWGLEW